MSTLKKDTRVKFKGSSKHTEKTTKVIKVSVVKDRYWILHPDGVEPAAIPELKGINYGVNVLCVSSEQLEIL